MGITARHSPFSICYYFGTNPTWFQFGIPREVEEHTPTLKFSVAFICIRSLLMGRVTPSFSLLKTNVGSSAASDTHTWLTSVAILVFKREGSTDRKWQPWQYTHGMLLLHAVTEILGFFTRQTILTPVGGSPAVGACTTSGRGCWFCVLRSFCLFFFNTWFCTYLTVLFRCLETGLSFRRSAHPVCFPFRSVTAHRRPRCYMRALARCPSISSRGHAGQKPRG